MVVVLRDFHHSFFLMVEVLCNNVSCHDAVVEQVMEGALRLSAALDHLGAPPTLLGGAPGHDDLLGAIDLYSSVNIWRFLSETWQFEIDAFAWCHRVSKSRDHKGDLQEYISQWAAHKKGWCTV